MSKSFKAAALAAVTALILTAPVLAPRVYAQSSPTSIATEGVFSTEVEDSMDVHYYSGVEFDKWFGFVGYESRPSLGYATRFGDLYLGAWYNGNIASTNRTEIQTVVQDYDLTSQLLTGKTTTLRYNSQRTTSYNSLNVLIGVAGMGFKVGFAEDLDVWDYPNQSVVVREDANGVTKTYTGDYVVDDYTHIEGWLTPSLEWGMSLEAGDLTIRPKVNLAFGIYRDTEILNTKGPSGTYTTVNGEILGVEQINRQIGRINDYLAPSVSVGVGFDISPTTSFGIEYGLGFDIYNNSYDGSGFSGTVPGEVSWNWGQDQIARSLATTTTTKSATLDIEEPTNWSHSVSLSFYYSDEIADGLKLGFAAGIPASIDLTSSNEYSITNYYSKTEYNSAVEKVLGSTTETVTVTPGTLTDTSVFTIGLNAAVGASYALVPDRFTINAGIGFAPVGFSSTTTKTSEPSVNSTTTTKNYDADGNLIIETVSFGATTDQTSDSVSVNNEWRAFAVRAAAGFTLNFNENAALDAAFAASSTFNLNISQIRLLFSFKF